MQQSLNPPHEQTPSPPGLWYFGHLFPLARDPLAFHVACQKKYGDVVLVRLPGMKIYLVSHPDCIDEVLRHRHKSFTKDIMTQRLSILLGKGLLTSEGEYWRKQRKMAQPFFNTAAVQSFDQMILDHTDRMLAKWNDNEIHDIHADMYKLTLRIIAQRLFSLEVEEEADKIAEAIEEMVHYFVGPWSVWPFLSSLPIPPNIRFRRALAKLDEQFYRIIAVRRKDGGEGNDLLGFLLKARDEDGKAMTDEQLRDELMTLFLAGHDTTALTLCYAFYLLGANPDKAARLEGEIAGALGGRRPVAADMARMPYTSWVVQESMRLYPPAWLIGRMATEDVELAGHMISKGCQVWMAQWIVHRDARWFDDPEAFIPERFDPDTGRKPPRGAYFPFGDGPRVCIGNHFALLESNLVLARVLQKFTVELMDHAPPRLIPSVTLHPKDGIRVRVRSRAPISKQTFVAR